MHHPELICHKIISDMALNYEKDLYFVRASENVKGWLAKMHEVIES